MRARGFSLIGLLVVIAIVAVLAALVLPAPEPAVWPGPTVMYRHRGKASFVFADGHVGAVARGGLLRRDSNWKWH